MADHELGVETILGPFFARSDGNACPAVHDRTFRVACGRKRYARAPVLR